MQIVGAFLDDQRLSSHSRARTRLYVAKKRETTLDIVEANLSGLKGDNCDLLVLCDVNPGDLLIRRNCERGKV